MFEPGVVVSQGKRISTLTCAWLQGASFQRWSLSLLLGTNAHLFNFGSR